MYTSIVRRETPFAEEFNPLGRDPTRAYPDGRAASPDSAADWAGTMDSATRSADARAVDSASAEMQQAIGAMMIASTRLEKIVDRSRLSRMDESDIDEWVSESDHWLAEREHILLGLGRHTVVPDTFRVRTADGSRRLVDADAIQTLADRFIRLVFVGVELGRAALSDVETSPIPLPDPPDAE